MLKAGHLMAVYMETATQTGDKNFPPARNPPDGVAALPYCMLGDEAFPLKTYIMRPYPQRVLDDQKR